MFKMKYGFGLVLLVSLFLLSCSKFSRLQKRGTLDEKLEAGIAYYEKGQYYKSSVLLEEIVPLLKGQAKAEQALIYLAYDYYMQDQFPMSTFYFHEFSQTYTRNERHEEAMFMYSKSLYKESPRYNLDQTNTYAALKAIQAFVNRYPKSTYVAECNTIMDELTAKLEEKEYNHAKLYHKIHNYKSAVVALSNFMDEFPGSIHNEELSFLRIEAQYKLAKNSVGGKVQLERYYDAIGFYRSFVEKYANSEFSEKAKAYSDLCESDLAKIKS
jgi:outer membrane protein assembly factor BamD